MLLAGSDAIGPKTAISVAGDPMLLPTEQATSLSIALLEIVRAIAVHEPHILHFAVTSTKEDQWIDIRAERDGGSALDMALDDVFSRQLVEASLTQIGASMTTTRHNDGTMIRLLLPMAGKAANPLQPGWHRLLAAMPGKSDVRH
jgi:two-component sensor histidine kinase